MTRRSITLSTTMSEATHHTWHFSPVNIVDSWLFKYIFMDIVRLRINNAAKCTILIFDLNANFFIDIHITFNEKIEFSMNKLPWTIKIFIIFYIICQMTSYWIKIIIASAFFIPKYIQINNFLENKDSYHSYMLCHYIYIILQICKFTSSTCSFRESSSLKCIVD